MAAAAIASSNLFGQSLRDLDFGHLKISERSYLGGFRTPRHVHERALFCFVLDGSYIETYGAKSRQCVRSSILFHAAHEPHEEHFEERGGRSLIVQGDVEWLARLPGSLDRATMAFRAGELPPVADKIYREFSTPDEATPMVIEGLLMELAGAMWRAREWRDTSPPLWLLEARDNLRASLGGHITLEQLASSADVHPVHFAQSFRRFFHCTPGEYVRRLRIEFACAELVSTQKPIAEIARTSGFADQSHLTRTFRRLLGTSPARYRATTRRAS